MSAPIKCYVDGCESPVERRWRCKKHLECPECGHPRSHFVECPKIDAGGMEEQR